jgi:cell fate (sporulation/competence/biofilm development) regulator YlbF (YheA/YmcA/DUF963 family)
LSAVAIARSEPREAARPSQASRIPRVHPQRISLFVLYYTSIIPRLFLYYITTSRRLIARSVARAAHVPSGGHREAALPAAGRVGDNHLHFGGRCGVLCRWHAQWPSARASQKVSRLNMAAIIEETSIARKTRELCETILDEPSVKSLRERIDAFMADEKSREQYDSLVAKGQELQQKQQNAVALTGEEISDFEQQRDSLLKNPVARGFLDAQQELHQVQESIHKFVNKTFELGRLPSEADLEEGCCGDHGCGCSH